MCKGERNLILKYSWTNVSEVAENNAIIAMPEWTCFWRHLQLSEKTRAKLEDLMDSTIDYYATYIWSRQVYVVKHV